MNMKGPALVLIVILKVVSVKSACDDYLTCLSSFFNVFFNEKDKPPPLDSVLAQNSESRKVNIDTKDLDQILHDVSSFLKEEIEIQPNIDLNSMLYRQVYNQTAIYVKTFDISNESLEDSHDNKKVKIHLKPNVKSEIVNPALINLNVSIDGSNFSTTVEEVSDVTPAITKFMRNISTPNMLTKKSLKWNNAKVERENEIQTEDDSNLYYDNDDDNTTDYPILDYIEFYKDTTNEYVNFEPTVMPNVKDNMFSDANHPLHNNIINSTLENITKGYVSNIEGDVSSFVFPWIAAIFVKDSTSDQFNYYCDGALLSHTAIVTAASCVQANNSTVKADDVIVLLGKTSLKVMKENEKVARIRDIKKHENFTERNEGNDLAILITEEPVIFTDGIQAATLGTVEHKEDLFATTGWATTGELTTILLEPTEQAACGEEAEPEDALCAVYGNDITVCPSFGGLYVTRQDTWILRGIRISDPEDRGLCFNKNIAFTSLNSHWEWIKVHM